MGNKPNRKSQHQRRKSVATKQAMPNPWGKRVGAPAALLVVVAVVGVIELSPEPAIGLPVGTQSLDVAAPSHAEGELHEDGEVPAGGEHNPVWLNCGFYDSEVDSEFAVHSLEHGAVWITYNPSIGAEGIDRLRTLVQRDRKVIVSPVASLEDPVLATAWANQLRLYSADDDRIEQFINEFSGSFNAPEPAGSCRGGVGNPTF